MNVRAVVIAPLLLAFGAPALADNQPRSFTLELWGFTNDPHSHLHSKEDKPGTDCQPGYEITLGWNISLRVPAVCPGPNQVVFPSQSIAFNYEWKFPRMGFFEDAFSFNRPVEARISPAVPVIPKSSAENSPPPSTDKIKPGPISFGSDHGGICPELANSAADKRANDPKTVCTCTASYLRHIADQAVTFRDAHPNMNGDPQTTHDLNQVAWVAGLTQSDVLPGWKWRCDLLEHPPVKDVNEPLPEMPVRPEKGWFESTADYAEKMQIYKKQHQDYFSKTMMKKSAGMLDKMKEEQNAAAIADIPDLSYRSIMGALGYLWDMENQTFMNESINLERKFLSDVEQADFTLWSKWAKTLSDVTLIMDNDHYIHPQLNAMPSHVDALCRTYDNDVNTAITPAADSIRRLAKEVKTQHDQMMKEIKLLAAFSARDGFPKSGNDGTSEAYGGFLGLEPMFFKDLQSPALHPGFGAYLRPKETDSYLGVGWFLVPAPGRPGRPGDAPSPPEVLPGCNHMHLDKVPIGFETELDEQHFTSDSDGDAAAAVALKNGDYDKVMFWLDVLKANDYVDEYASGADAEERP